VSARRGFTLIELLVAIVLTGVVALLVYGAVGAATEVQARVGAERDALQSERAMRAAIEDALRNARPSAAYGDTVFELDDEISPTGRPADRLSFVAAGGLAPLTADADWVVTIEPSPDGLLLTGVPIGFAAPPRAAARLAGVTGLEVRALPAGASASWTDRWSARTELPRAVELTLWADSGAIGPPIVVAVPLGVPR
jgi:prepilin-type N-terminal cleavage/methylation domain-containing protein